MKTRFHLLTWMTNSFVILASSFVISAFGQGTAFTCQGQLYDGANPASGIYDLRFAIYDASGGGTQHGPALTNGATAVSNGLFTVTLNFGYDVFTGNPRWLEIGVRTNGGGPFSTLSPRQQLTPTPYAIHAAYAGDIEPGANVSFSANGVVSFQSPTPFYLGPQATNMVNNLNAQYLAGKDAGRFWWLGGNSGQLPSDYILGTLDNQPLEFKVNGQRALRLEPNPVSPNIMAGSFANVVTNGFFGAVIGGGGSALYPNRVGANYATVVGGAGNTASGLYSTAMGRFTRASNDDATAMGLGCIASGWNSSATRRAAPTNGVPPTFNPLTRADSPAGWPSTSTATVPAANLVRTRSCASRTATWASGPPLRRRNWKSPGTRSSMAFRRSMARSMSTTLEAQTQRSSSRPSPARITRFLWRIQTARIWWW